MNTSESFRALRRANPRAKPDFAETVAAAVVVVRGQLGATPATAAGTSRGRRRLVGVSVGASLAGAALVATLLTVGSPGGGTGVEDATAAVKTAAAVTAAAAERSGTAIVRITHNDELWAGSTIRWNHGDLAVAQDTPGRDGRVGSRLLLVDGMMYGVEPDEGGWVELGSPASIDPGSGTTPDDYLSAAREDVGGPTLRRMTAGMSGATTRRLDDGSAVYSGTVPAGLLARRTGFKEGQTLRILPFGYVAHDEAADPAAPLDAAVTVGADGIVRQVAVSWGTSSSAWTYTVMYRALGKTAALVAPANAEPLRRAGSGRR
ncbi:MAG: hypothetical protein ACRDNH_12875 [Gaiellaceae bacterium]